MIADFVQRKGLILLVVLVSIYTSQALSASAKKAVDSQVFLIDGGGSMMAHHQKVNNHVA